MVDSVRDFQGAELKFHDVWSLSADGKTLTINNHVAVPQGEFDLDSRFSISNKFLEEQV